MYRRWSCDKWLGSPPGPNSNSFVEMQRPAACMPTSSACTSFFHFFFFFISSYLLAHCSSSTTFIYWLIIMDLRWGTGKAVKPKNEWDGCGRNTRRKACESGWYVWDNRRKVPTVGHLGELERDLGRDLPRDTRRLELSVCYHTHTAIFARLSSYLRIIIIISLALHSLIRVASVPQVSFFISLASK